MYVPAFLSFSKAVPAFLSGFKGQAEQTGKKKAAQHSNNIPKYSKTCQNTLIACQNI
jgi:hypothetical protein